MHWQITYTDVYIAIVLHTEVLLTGIDNTYIDLHI